jgi:hypothetical protein
VFYKPAADFVWEQHLELTDRVFKARAAFLGGIVLIPTCGSEKSLNLACFAASLAPLPIVYVDQNRAPKQQLADNSAYVYVSDRQGGRSAARAIVAASRKRRIERVFAVSGLAKPGRVTALNEGLNGQFHYAESFDGGIDREDGTNNAGRFYCRTGQKQARARRVHNVGRYHFRDTP